MAGTAQPKSQWGAVFVIGTFLAISAGFGVFVGPIAMDCAKGSASFGACLQQGLVERGFVPPADDADSSMEMAAIDPESAANAETQATETAVSPKSEMAVEPAKPESEPQPDQVTNDSAEPESATPEGALTFGLRAEPDGSLLVVGSGKPGEQVKIFANGELLGETEVENTGDWVFLPDAPLPPGGAEISVSDANGEGGPDNSYVVVIADDLKSEPLVVASAPGEASQILQGLTASPEVQSTPAADSVPAPETVPDMQIAAADPAVQLPAENENDVASDLSVIPEVSQSAPAVVVPDVPPTIDAIEIDGDRNFFAGGGTEGAVVRLYVEDQYVADATVEGGRWLVETNENLLTDPSQRVRIDMLQSGSSDVAARAEVNFDFVQEDAPIQVAATETPEPLTEQPVVAVEQVDTAEADANANTSAETENAINAAASNNASSQLIAPPTVSVETVAPTLVEAVPNPEDAINSAASDNAANQLATPPELPVSTTAPIKVAAVEPETTEPSAPVQEAPEQAEMVKPDPSPAAAIANQAPMSEGAEKPADMATANNAQPAIAEEEPAATAQTPEPSANNEQSTTVAAVVPNNAAPAVTDEPVTAPAIDTNSDVQSKAASEPQLEMAAKPARGPADTSEPAPADQPAIAQNEASSPASSTQVPTLVARATGEGRFVSGQAIIRRGDNLWTIARRVYGEGIRYSTIYQANQGQIRDPNLIYPGQVFSLPDEGGQ